MAGKRTFDILALLFNDGNRFLRFEYSLSNRICLMAVGFDLDDESVLDRFVCDLFVFLKFISFELLRG